MHLAHRRPWSLDHIAVIMDTLARPDFHALDSTVVGLEFWQASRELLADALRMVPPPVA